MSEQRPQSDASIPDDELRIPDALADAMRAGDVTPPRDNEALDALDQRVLTRAAAELNPPRAKRFAGLKFSAALVAACLLVALTVRVSMNLDTPAIAGDIDRSGTVNAIDSYQLARMLSLGVTPPEHADFNGDGKADGQDIDGIQGFAVRVPDEPRPVQRRAAPPHEMGFTSVAITITSPRPVAVVQWTGHIKGDHPGSLVGIEGGQPPFDTPPTYDPRALGRDRITLAAQLNPQEAAKLKDKKHAEPFRLTTLHLQAPLNAPLNLVTDELLLADPEGNRIDPQRVQISFFRKPTHTGDTP